MIIKLIIDPMTWLGRCFKRDGFGAIPRCGDGPTSDRTGTPPPSRARPPPPCPPPNSSGNQVVAYPDCMHTTTQPKMHPEQRGITHYLPSLRIRARSNERNDSPCDAHVPARIPRTGQINVPKSSSIRGRSWFSHPRLLDSAAVHAEITLSRIYRIHQQAPR